MARMVHQLLSFGSWDTMPRSIQFLGFCHGLGSLRRWDIIQRFDEDFYSSDRKRELCIEAMVIFSK
jgi:hypothetical protein